MRHNNGPTIITLKENVNKNVVTKKLWSYIKSKRQDNIGDVGPLNFQGETHTDPLTNANIFANYFSSVFTNEDTSHIPSMEGDPLPCIDAIQVHSEGVAKLLSNIDPSKAHGPDNLPVRFLKEVSCEIAPALALIFQASLDQGILLEGWKQATVVPVFKRAVAQILATLDLSHLLVYALKYWNTLFTQTYQNTYKVMQYYAMHSMAFAQIEVVILN